MIRVFFSKLDNGNLEITEKMLNDILSYIKRQDKEIERLNNIIDNSRDYIMNNQSGGESENGHFHINFDGDIWELYELLRRY